MIPSLSVWAGPFSEAPMNCIFRRLAADDLPSVLEMNRTFRSGFLTEEGASVFLADTRNWLWVGMIDNRIIAFAYGYALDRLDGRRMLYLHEVGVSEEYQRQGIGTSLLETLKDECRMQSFHRIFLIAHQCNTAANALYRKCSGEVSCDSGGNDTTYMFFL